MAKSLLRAALALIFWGVAASGPALAQEPPGPPPEVWQTYHDYQALTDELAGLNLLFPDLTTVESIGKSVEGREIWLVTVTNKSLAGEKPRVFFDGAMHGSEVVAAESMLYYVKFLVEQYGSNPTAREIVDGWITYVVPMVNPDGVEHGKASDDYKAARKNTNLVDLNRNFDWNWSPDCGSSCLSPCRPSCFEYPGNFSFSEPESQIIRDQIVARRVSVYLSGHAGLSFEQLIRPGLFDDPAEENRHIAIQDCIRSLTPFRKTSGNQAGAAKNWAYGVPMRELREAGLHPLAFNLEIYSIASISPGFGNHFWWCRYNPPAAADDSVAQWCTNGAGEVPTDTLVSRMEKVKTALVYITQASVGVPECPAAARSARVKRLGTRRGLGRAGLR